MEIKKIEEKKIEYPKLNETSKIFVAASLPDTNIIAGGLSAYVPVYENVILGCSIVQFIALINIVISAIVVLYTKIRYKKDSDKNKISKKLKILMIISTIIFIAMNIVIPILGDIKHYRPV